MRKTKEFIKKVGLLAVCASLFINQPMMPVHAENDGNSDTKTEDSSLSGNSEEEDNRVSSTSEFLLVGDCVPTPSGIYGQKVHVILPIYNMGIETVTNMIITPIVSTKADEWPFAMDTVGLVQTVDFIPGSPNKDIAYQNRREVEWDLTIRKDALTGCYPLEFNVSY